MAGTLEVHEHSRIKPGTPRHVKHSHADTHRHHAGYGPATLSIDKHEWARQTGLRGGGTKKFTTRPTGPQI
jgi:hypothetical protein